MECIEADFLICGTGLAESILAAALSRAGKRVVHVDCADFYGGSSATHSFTRLDGERERIVPKSLYDNLPILLYAGGPLVDLLVRSRIGKYVDFRDPVGFYLWENESSSSSSSSSSKAWLQVPLSRSEVFSTSSLSPLEKRSIMRFFQACQEIATGTEDREMFSVSALMDEHKLNAKIRRMVLRFMLFEETEASCSLETFRSRWNWLVASCGVYAPNPMLYPFFGSAEIPQAFCRTAAVHGAVYILDCIIESATANTDAGREDTFKAHVVPRYGEGVSVCFKKAISFPVSTKSKAICCISSFPIITGLERGNYAVASVDGETYGLEGAVYILQSDDSLEMCPSSKYNLHFVSQDPKFSQDIVLTMLRYFAPATMDFDSDGVLMSSGTQISTFPTSVFPAESVLQVPCATSWFLYDDQVRVVESVFRSIVEDGTVFFPVEDREEEGEDELMRNSNDEALISQTLAQAAASSRETQNSSVNDISSSDRGRNDREGNAEKEG
eukprot:ANDGO_01960.mRNA.1 Rab proteins geranylgeranyltransferase component A